MNKPKVLFLDIETAPLLVHCWGIWQQNIALNQIKQDWHILSFSAKWLDSSKIIYFDQRKVKNIEDDNKLLKEVWKLLDECDVVVTQNGDKFDLKKLNARFILNGMQPPSSFKSIDTLKIARKHFAFTSNKLEYLSKNLNKQYKKQDHKKFPGFELWKACLAGNIEAWKEMERYNKYDVLSLEEVYKTLIPWDNSVNFNLFHDSEENICKCGNTEFQLNGFVYTTKGKFQRYKCKQCGAQTRGTENHFSKEKIKSLRVKI